MNAEQPKFTRIPNAILDSMADLTEPELRVLLAITRKTIGWQKECDPISLTQLETITGLSRPAVNKALHAAIAQGWVECTGRGKRGTGCYKLTSALVNDVNQLTEITSKPGLLVPVNDVNRSSPRLVNDVNTQKKDLKEKKERGMERATRTPPIPKQTNLDSFNQAVQIYKELSGKKQLAPTIITLIVNSVSDLDLWRRVIESWASCGYNVGGVKDMLDWYDHPEKMTARMARTGRPQANGYANGQRPPADLPLVTAAAQPTPDERRAAAQRRQAILEESRSAGK